MVTQDGESGAHLHWRALEGLYASAPINALFSSRLEIAEEGHARIIFDIDPKWFHAAGGAWDHLFQDARRCGFLCRQHAGHGPFPADHLVQSAVLAPCSRGAGHCRGRWISGRRRVLVAEARLIDEEGEEVGRGTGTFMRSQFALSSLPGYAPDRA
jgi:acyl-coenzyme A thioesterase PaaI-like protein